jgi:hypothetical protein
MVIDEDGMFTTQTLGLNPEVLRIMKSLIVSMIALIFLTQPTIYGAGCKMISFTNISKLFSKLLFL